MVHYANGNKIIIEIPSESRDLVHEVTFDMATQKWTCGCEHFHYRRVFCKHMQKAMEVLEKIGLKIISKEVDKESEVLLSTQKVAVVEVEDIDAIKEIASTPVPVATGIECGDVDGEVLGVIAGALSDMKIPVMVGGEVSVDETALIVIDRNSSVEDIPVGIIGVKKSTDEVSLLTLKKELIDLRNEQNARIDKCIEIVNMLL